MTPPPNTPSDSRDLFRDTAITYPRISRRLRWVGLLAIPFWALVFLTLKSGHHARTVTLSTIGQDADWRTVGTWVGFAGFALVIIGSLIYQAVNLPKLICPACQERMDPKGGLLGKALGPYCPECGEKDTIESGFLGPKCTACNNRLNTGKNGRSYKIHFCTRCGTYVDDVGV